jgi:hypothetical protein
VARQTLGQRGFGWGTHWPRNLGSPDYGSLTPGPLGLCRHGRMRYIALTWRKAHRCASFSSKTMPSSFR